MHICLCQINVRQRVVYRNMIEHTYLLHVSKGRYYLTTRNHHSIGVQIIKDLHITVVEEGAVRFKFMLNFRYALYSILKFKKKYLRTGTPSSRFRLFMLPPPPQTKKKPQKQTNKPNKKNREKNPSKSLYSGLRCGTQF